MSSYSQEQLDTLTEIFQRSLAASQSVRVALERVLEAAPKPSTVPPSDFDYITMPRRERRAMDLLASRPNCWFSSDKVVEAVYPDADTSPKLPHATVWAHMSKLRKRCRAHGVVIEAQRYTGYRLVL